MTAIEYTQTEECSQNVEKVMDYLDTLTNGDSIKISTIVATLSSGMLMAYTEEAQKNV